MPLFHSKFWRCITQDRRHDPISWARFVTRFAAWCPHFLSFHIRSASSQFYVGARCNGRIPSICTSAILVISSVSLLIIKYQSKDAIKTRSIAMLIWPAALTFASTGTSLFSQNNSATINMTLLALCKESKKVPRHMHPFHESISPALCSKMNPYHRSASPDARDFLSICSLTTFIAHV